MIQISSRADAKGEVSASFSGLRVFIGHRAVICKRMLWCWTHSSSDAGLTVEVGLYNKLRPDGAMLNS